MPNLFDTEGAKSLKNYSKISGCKKFKFYFKMLDLYALPITLRYKNQRKFYTNFGALTSVFIFILVFSMLGAELKKVFRDKE